MDIAKIKRATAAAREALDMADDSLDGGDSDGSRMALYMARDLIVAAYDAQHGFERRNIRGMNADEALDALLSEVEAGGW